jgi:hypothetical protein
MVRKKQSEITKICNSQLPVVQALLAGRQYADISTECGVSLQTVRTIHGKLLKRFSVEADSIVRARVEELRTLVLLRTPLPAIADRLRQLVLGNKYHGSTTLHAIELVLELLGISGALSQPANPAPAESRPMFMFESGSQPNINLTGRRLTGNTERPIDTTATQDEG